MVPHRIPQWSRLSFLAAGLVLAGGTAWAQTTTQPNPPGTTQPGTTVTVPIPTPTPRVTPAPPPPIQPPRVESEERQIIIGGTISTVPFSGCPSTSSVPALQVQFLGLTIGVGADEGTVVHDRTETGAAVGSDAILQTGQFVDVVGTAAGSCVLADRIVIRTNGHLVVRGPITSLVGSQITVQGATFDIDSNTRIFAFRGIPATLADLRVGTFVRAGGPLRSTGNYLARRVHIGAEFHAEGAVTAVGTGTSTITVAGRVISIPSTVQIFQRSVHIAPEETSRSTSDATPVPGGQAGDTSLLRVGSVVTAYGQVDDTGTTYTADRVYIFGQRRATFEGTVSALSGNTFNLDILTGVSIPVVFRGRVSGPGPLALGGRTTSVRGGLANGATVVVIGEFNDQNVLNALNVVVRSRVQFLPPSVRPPTGPTGPATPSGPGGRGPGDDRGPGDRR